MCFLILLLLCSSTQAGLIGYFSGNDNADVVSKIVDTPVIQIGKIETDGWDFTYEGVGDQVTLDYIPIPGTTAQGHIYYLTNLAYNGEIFMSGTIESDLDIKYFTTKAGNGFNLYSWDDSPETWDTYNTCSKLSHVSLYSTVPEPSSFLMVSIFVLFIIFNIYLLKRFK